VCDLIGALIGRLSLSLQACVALLVLPSTSSRFAQLLWPPPSSCPKSIESLNWTKAWSLLLSMLKLNYEEKWVS